MNLAEELKKNTKSLAKEVIKVTEDTIKKEFEAEIDAIKYQASLGFYRCELMVDEGNVRWRAFEDFLWRSGFYIDGSWDEKYITVRWDK